MSHERLGLDALRSQLPAPYELVLADAVDDALAQALRLGRAGADEGTLLWPASAAGVNPGTLLATLLLRPEEPPPSWPQLAALAAVSAGSAIAELCQPMTPLYYRWPDRLDLGPDPLGRILFRRDGELLALGWRVHILPPDDTMPEYATLTVDGGADTTPGEVLGRLCRFFLDGINRWAEEGFEPIRRAWLRRGILDRAPATAPQTRPVDVDAEGNLVVEGDKGPGRLSLARALGLG